MTAVLAGFALFPALPFSFISEGSIQSEPVLNIKNAGTPSKQEQVSFGLPLHLRIPKINVDAAIERVGLTPEGAMDISESLDDVAWYKNGPRPGENGSAVIAGHYGERSGKIAVFNDLYKLSKGDQLSIKDSKGVIISFVVRKIKIYDPNADASDVFFSSDRRSHLNLVTCAGVWNEDSKTFSNRLVVFTDKK